jgi:hypothetical protein
MAGLPDTLVLGGDTVEEKVEIALDQEWVYLIQEALKLGISKEEIKVFFVEKSDQRT